MDDITNRDRYNQERQESAQNRKKIVIERAEELFLAKGLAKVSMNHIMDAAGISKATLYRYFKNIDEIIFDIQMSKMNELFYHTETPTHPLPFILEMIDRFSDHRDAYRFIGMFDNHYSDSYPNEELARQYEKHFIRKGDGELASSMGDLPEELNDRFIIVLNVVISFLQRMALRGKILEKYQGISVERQLDELKNMVKREFAF